MPIPVATREKVPFAVSFNDTFRHLMPMSAECFCTGAIHSHHGELSRI
jgi:hypothetical protein